MAVLAAQLNSLLIVFLVLAAAVVILILLIGGFILLIRRFVKEQTDLTNRQKAIWKKTLEQLGLEFDPHNEESQKPFDVAGEYRNCTVKVVFPVVQSGEGSSDIYTSCEAFFPTSLNIGFEIKTEGKIKRALNSVLGKNTVESGLADFNRSFAVGCPSSEKARQLLTTDLPGEKTRNLADDLVLIKKSVEYIKITDESVYLKNKGLLLELEEIKPILDAAVYLVKRIQTVRGQLAENFSQDSRLFS